MIGSLNIARSVSVLLLVLAVASLQAIGQDADDGGLAVDTLIVDTAVSNPKVDSDRDIELRLAIESLKTEVATLRSELADARVNTQSRTRRTGRTSVAGDLNQVRTRLPSLIWNVFKSFLVILITYYMIRAISWLLEVLAERDARRRLLFKGLVPIVRVLLWITSAYVIVDVVFEVTQQQLFAASAAVGVAIGFASQDILKNIFGGLIIILDKPFQVGDKIRVGGTYGEVVSIGLRATRIQTPEDNLVSVPNAQVVDGQVSNANAGNLDCQVVTDLFLPGWVDVMKAKRICYEAAANSQYVFLDKPIVVNVSDEFRETFLTLFKVKAYVIDTRFENRFISDVTETAKAEFMREGMLSPMVDLKTVTQSHLSDIETTSTDKKSD
jgi:small-conductance mechanosensitive channel